MSQVLPFLLGEGLYGLELTHIQEVVDDAMIYYLPGSPEGILGAINLHGRIRPVLDLPLLFGFEKGSRASRLIVPATEDFSLVLAVSSVRSILSFESEQIKPCQNVFDRECVRNVLDSDGERIRLVDLQILRERIEQFV